MKYYGDDGTDAYVHELEAENEWLKKEVERLLGIIRQYETVEHEWHAENGAVIKDAV